MTTITVKINEKSDKAKVLLSILKTFGFEWEKISEPKKSTGKTKEKVYQLSPEEIEGIKEGEADIKAGNVLTMDEFKKQAKKYL